MATSPALPKLVRQRTKRRQDPRLIRGRGTYVDDIALVGMQHLAFKRSDVAHGRIRSIDTSAAKAMDGVEAVFTGAEIAEFLAPMPIGTPFPSPDHRAVAVDTVRYAGHPVAGARAPCVPPVPAGTGAGWASAPVATSLAMPRAPWSCRTTRCRRWSTSSSP